MSISSIPALAELRAGRKRSHWVWFVFPQLQGLGRSPMAQHYGLSGLAEARAYAAHPVLGPRLRECVRALLGHAGTSAARLLGEVDALKLRSCLTLFEAADPLLCGRRRQSGGLADVGVRHATVP